MDSPPAVPPAPTLAQAFPYWLKLGFVSFGGPATQIAMMHQELVERRRWVSEHRFLHALNYCMLPGPEAIQLAIYIAWLMHGIAGAVLAGVPFFLPAFALLSFVCTRFFKLDFPWIVLIAAIIGAIGGRLAPAKFKGGGGHGASHKQYGPAIIDDNTPPPAHAAFSWGKLLATTAIFIAVGAMAMAAAAASQTLWGMGEFFTGAAFLTIGGAYAVLPYVYQGAVERYGWLTGPQMMDSLALGERTPRGR